MTTDLLANRSRILATATLVLVVSMLLANIAYWVFPDALHTVTGGFNLTAMIGQLDANISLMPWWQAAGGIVLSSIPLLILAKGLLALRSLFLAYSKGEYFSSESADLLGKVGKSVLLWVLASLVLTPVMSVWITFTRPAGERLLSINFEPSHIVALFLSASLMIIARSLSNACSLARENEQFV
ncbi:DUF2975 domain-containing protein [Pseudomonas helleri]|uniref:DUF2975 domain-containing protein n=2 Tax=Pseudomonas helleri TaxID=1608996 RepID=A0A6I1WNN7_9PSED|nr:DUF2975 domain-containing protein [Pseudomonas helleri]MQT77727.1 DUF2975 domain-containing protein [Pseudomonas helleri]MQU08418.1 DUF2975 domain-containing protein [Pseudomonas helleri]MQU43658.1 DUF2975 domain-containing protein [Pseudomonas helleri]